jgi:hypothetical protein
MIKTKIKYEPVVSFAVGFDKFMFDEKNQEWIYIERFHSNINFDEVFFRYKDSGQHCKSLVKKFIINDYPTIKTNQIDWNDFDEFL